MDSQDKVREIELELAHLYGDRKVTEQHLQWLELKINELQDILFSLHEVN